MTGTDTQQRSLFVYVNLDKRIPAKHPIGMLHFVVVILSSVNCRVFIPLRRDRPLLHSASECYGAFSW